MFDREEKWKIKTINMNFSLLVCICRFGLEFSQFSRRFDRRVSGRLLLK